MKHRQAVSKRPGAMRPASGVSRNDACVYFSEVLMLSKVPLNEVPTPLTAVMIAMAMPAAIRPYSMAVAPDSFFKNFKMSDFMAGSDLGFVFPNRGFPQFHPRNYGEKSKVVITPGAYFSG